MTARAVGEDRLWAIEWTCHQCGRSGRITFLSSEATRKELVYERIDRSHFKATTGICPNPRRAVKPPYLAKYPTFEQWVAAGKPTI